MQDSLDRIQTLSKEVWAVKLADRITNLQKPPAHWDNGKKQKYLEEANVILEILNGGNTYLENRLKMKILEYEVYLK
jgi:guanosine-3',5'-bis(diphosphate) 3'-pyrophosphohydrolase